MIWTLIQKLVRKLSAILKQNDVRSVHLDDQSDFQMMTVISPSPIVRKHGAPKYCTEIFKIWKMYIPETWKIILFIYLLQHPKPNFVRQGFIFLPYQNQVCLHNEQEKFWRKQSAILRLIKSITRFSKVIGYHQPDLSTNNIPKEITRVWLAENGYIFYVTRVQSCDTRANDK